MPLITAIDNILQNINTHATKILSKGGGDKKLLFSLHEVINDIRRIIDISTHQELDGYCQKYNGFYRYAKVLEGLADEIASNNVENYG